MTKIQTKPLTLLAAGLVFGFYLLVASVRGLNGPIPTELTDDALILKLAEGAALFSILFFAGHKTLEKFGIVHYAAYCALGSACAVVLHVLNISDAVWDQVIAHGSLSTHLMVPAFIGAVLGSGYRRVSAITDYDEDVEGLAGAYDRQIAEQDGEADDDAGLIAHGDMEYFDGPLQVRTSFPALLLAAFVGCVANIMVTTIFQLSTYTNFKIADKETLLNIDLIWQAMGGFMTGLVFSFLTFLPVIFLVLLAHMALRGLSKTSYAAYGLAGLLSSPVAIILTGGLAAITAFAVIPAMVAALAYRRFAGLEPAPVAEDIVARNRRDLVGKNHIRRKAGRVLMAPGASVKAPLFSRKVS